MSGSCFILTVIIDLQCSFSSSLQNWLSWKDPVPPFRLQLCVSLSVKAPSLILGNEFDAGISLLQHLSSWESISWAWRVRSALQVNTVHHCYLVPEDSCWSWQVDGLVSKNLQNAVIKFKGYLKGCFIQMTTWISHPEFPLFSRQQQVSFVHLLSLPGPSLMVLS